MNTNPNQPFIDSGWKFIIAVSGGGQQILGDLTIHGGMSSCLLEGIVPYSQNSFYEFIGGRVDHIVSPSAARAAAMVCYQRARQFAPSHEKVFGFASTGSVVKVGGEREGRRHKVHMAIQDAVRTISIDIEYRAGRDRLDEELLTRNCIREALRWGCHLFGDIQKRLTTDDNLKVTTYEIENPEWAQLVDGKIHKIGSDGQKAVFSSSFNPMHEGHLNMIRDARKKLEVPISLELCIRNADKPPLDYLTIEERLKGMYDFMQRNGEPLFPASKSDIGSIILTDLSLFFDKSYLFTNCTFIVGRDTYDRIFDISYYHSSYTEMNRGLKRFKQLGHKFLVYPRKGYISRTPVYPKDFEDITIFVTDFEPPEISSTEIRKASRADS